MTAPITITQLNTPAESWREFRKGYTKNDISDDPHPTSIALDQMVDNVSVEEQAKFPLDSTKNTSLLWISENKIKPLAVNFEGLRSGYADTMMITGFSVPPAMAGIASVGPSADGTTVSSVGFTGTTYVTWNFNDILGYDGRRIDFVFIKASLEVRKAYIKSVASDSALGTMDYGGGLYMDLFNMGMWTPIYSAGYLSGRTFMMPVDPYNQTSLRVMAIGAYRWSVQFLGIITGA